MLGILAQVNSPRVDLLEVYLRGGKQVFGKILKFTLPSAIKRRRMTTARKAIESDLDKVEDKKKGLARDVADLETAIDDEIDFFAASAKQINIDTVPIESKIERIGKSGVEIWTNIGHPFANEGGF